jgi:hypothetical protein
VAEEEEQAEVLGERAESRPRTTHTVQASPEEAAPQVQAVTAQQLPFTGLDTGLLAVMGAGLLGTGIVLRRRTQLDS